VYFCKDSGPCLFQQVWMMIFYVED
jgi:hypothetical protein